MAGFHWELTHGHTAPRSQIHVFLVLYDPTGSREQLIYILSGAILRRNGHKQRRIIVVE